jgi:hypothetical protein
MSETFQPAQKRRPANLAALRQGLQEMVANRKLSATTKERPVIVQAPVMVVRGK